MIPINIKILSSLLYIFLLSNLLFGQKMTPSIANWGLRYSFYHNYKVLHHSPVVTLDYKNHNLYVGPEFSTVLKTIKGDPIDKFEKNAYGVNFGYRYTFNKNCAKKLTLFGQLNFSIYKVRVNITQMGPHSPVQIKQLIIENTGSFGLNYKITKGISLFTGVGFGSFDMFFMVVDSFTPSGYAGISIQI